MSWIAADADLPNKPKVRQMARSLGLDRWSVTGRLVSVWGWFDKASADGFIAGAVAADVDDLAGHDGFADAMQLVGWLVIEQDGLLIPDFDDHHGNSAKKRALGALRQGRYRNRKSDALSVTRDAGHISPEQQQATGNGSKTAENSTCDVPSVTQVSTQAQEGDVLVTPQSSPQNITEQNNVTTNVIGKRAGSPNNARAAESPPAQPTTAGTICRRLRELGMAHVNPSHTSLVELLGIGVTEAQLVDTGRECIETGHADFRYLLKTMRGRLADAAMEQQRNAHIPPGTALAPTTRNSKQLNGLNAIEELKRGFENEDADRDGAAENRLVEPPVEPSRRRVQGHRDDMG